MDDIGFYIVVLLGLIFMFVMGYVNGLPSELDNGCIVYDSNVYCTEVTE